MRYEEVAEAVRGVPIMSPEQGRRIYDHIVSTGAEQVLDIGTLYGVSAAYQAAAASENGRGHVTTVDSILGLELKPQELIERVGLADRVTFVHTPHSSYNWWLKEEIEKRVDDDGNVEPIFDFCYLDGSHNFTTDGLAVFLIEKLLRPGGWLLLDDLRWTYEQHPGALQSDGVTHPLSPEEQREPHMRAVFDLVVRLHPEFTVFRDDSRWGWAQKNPGAPRRYTLETREQFRRVALRNLRQLKARIARR